MAPSRRPWFPSSVVQAPRLERGGDGRLQLGGRHLALLRGVELLEKLVNVEGVILVVVLLLRRAQGRVVVVAAAVHRIGRAVALCTW
jgi:hypothetical protein